ncbi:hypothetical protein AB204_12995 [Xenorhabdus khoisanae]|uniref:Uncharacterized protein n=1 Tax=Xenorhabdus khoisanae TaxID=880157 RepID=A0A0J5FQV7_9GAMM|nr:hypothetical protein [Xenorhabdus khoisanae]KMJ44686.1 hypothetical protein AB204_12995 [Xenorhabdus khoisanae]
MFMFQSIPNIPDVHYISEDELNKLKKELERDHYPQLKVGDKVILLNDDEGVVEEIFNNGAYDCRMERTGKLHMLPPDGMYITPTGYKGYSLDWDETIKINNLKENNHA